MTLKLVGKKFGRLTVQSQNPTRASLRNIRWDCICDCGNKVIVIGSNLVRKQTESCGCFQKEVTQQTFTTHGMARTKTYATWASIIQKCTNKQHDRYHIYGGKGIKVCDRWLTSFENFLEDMGQKPPGKSMLKRIQTDDDYNKDNCKWIVNEVAVDKVRA